MKAVVAEGVMFIFQLPAITVLRVALFIFIIPFVDVFYIVIYST